MPDSRSIETWSTGPCYFICLFVLNCGLNFSFSFRILLLKCRKIKGAVDGVF